MTIEVGGYSANSKLEVDSKLSARVFQPGLSWSPQVPFVGGGSYSRKMVSGFVVANPASGSLYQFRWTNNTLVADVKRIMISFAKSGAISAQPFNCSLHFLRFFSAAGSGGTAFSGSDHGGKERNVMAPTTVADMRINTTVNTGLTAGTWQSDVDALAAVCVSSLASGTPVPVPEFGNDGIQVGRLFTLWESLPGEQPITLAAQEGLNITQNSFALSGINWFFTIRIEWDELPI